MFEELKERLQFLYPKDWEYLYKEIQKIVKDFKTNKKREKELSEKDIFLITYGDQFHGKEEKPLKYLKKFCDEFVKNHINIIHILPFFPYSSDDGFSVIDYRRVNPELGDWEDIENLSRDYRLMFDLVCNHVSSQSEWFKKYLEGDLEYKDYFIEVDPNLDLSLVVRPRALPLLTPFETEGGKKYLWTTFSNDQIDLNYKNPKVLIEMIKILLFYVEKGADFIRLDAIAYLWKEIGTKCIHLRETHTIVQIFRNILNIVAPEVMIITETNVPHLENISYFGDGYNEAQLVYQFPLPPLVLYTFENQNSEAFNFWAKDIEPISLETNFLNFLASHDGIGLNPIRGIVGEEEIIKLVEVTKRRGGLVSYKYNSDGSISPYELNISYFNALSDDEEEEDIKIKKFINAYGIIFALQGVPTIYIHSLVGSQNCYKCVERTGHNRSINREKFYYEEIKEELKNSSNLRYKIYESFIKLLSIRKKEKAFDPRFKQEILEIDKRVIGIKRKGFLENIIAIHNISSEIVNISLDIENKRIDKVFDLINNKEIPLVNNKLYLKFNPYEFLWLKYNTYKEA